MSLRRAWLLFVCVLMFAAPPVSGQLFSNLESFARRLDVGDPAVEAETSLDGPKGIATALLNEDELPDLAVSNTDGTVTVYFGLENGRFGAPGHLQTGEQELRGIICADVTGDGRADVITASPYAGRVFVFVNEGGAFSSPISLALWPGARNLVAGDFDGDGLNDLVVAGTTNGLRQLRSTGGGGFEVVTTLTSLSSTNNEFPKPVYSMATHRPPGASRDQLLVTHADSELVWALVPDEAGVLAVSGSVKNPRNHAIVAGPITRPAASGEVDLVAASTRLGTIDVHVGADTPAGFADSIHQRMHVPGGPRALQIVDLDEDGWNDLVVVLRNFDRVLTYHNSNGVLIAATEMPVGKSPRELVAADFNDDGLPDVAVMNRDSMDVSVLFTYPGQAGFSALDQVYPVDGEVSGLRVLDFNRDGRDDVVQIHRASGEISVRLASTNGLLGAPSFFPMGDLPSAQSTVDVNNDGFPDIVTANMGKTGLEPGSVSVRLGDGEGGFGPEERYFLPDEERGRLFALVAGDFDGDGKIDLAAGFFDCRLAFFQGHGDGSFSFTRSHLFVYEARVMVAGDFDQDGDLDIAGAGYAGDVVVVENLGDMLTAERLKRVDYPSPSKKKFGTRDIVTADVNNDGDLDLIVGSGKGTMLFYGAAGMEFFRASEMLPGTDFPAAGVAVGDFDTDGVQDIAVACRILSCVTILTLAGDIYQPATTVDVPSGDFLAAGDLDGDGHDDLVGTGSVLWTVLSSRRAQPAPPSVEHVERPKAPRPVINELLAINNKVPVELDGGRTSDWLEVYNDGSSLSLRGWKLRLMGGEGGEIQEFSFPATAFVASKGYVVVFFSETLRTLYHTGFRLPGEGGEVALVNSSGEEIDRVRYPRQQENVSYGRYADGLEAFVFNPYPGPARENKDNGPVEPVAELEGIEHATLAPDRPIRFNASGRDDVGIVGLTLVYRRLDVPDFEEQRILLYDDGMHEDGESLDGWFSGLLEPGLPAGGEIQFYVEAVDLSDRVVVLPDQPVFARPGEPLALFSLAVGTARPSVEISEVVAWNTNGLRDELGFTPDWVEIRNCSDSPVSLDGVALSQGFFSIGSRYEFEEGAMLEPGDYRVIYCDNSPERGRPHASFSLNREGDEIFLTGAGPNGARSPVDSLRFEAQAADVAYARLGCGGTFRATAPTPMTANAVDLTGELAEGGSGFNLVFPTERNKLYTLESADRVDAAGWVDSSPLSGDGVEKVVSEPLGERRFYRLRVEDE